MIQEIGPPLRLLLSQSILIPMTKHHFYILTELLCISQVTEHQAAEGMTFG